MSGYINSIAGTTIALILGVIFLFFFFKFLPVILVLGVAVYGGFKIRAAWKKKKNKEFDYSARAEKVDFTDKDEYDLSGRQVIDVEYYDAEK